MTDLKKKASTLRQKNNPSQKQCYTPFGVANIVKEIGDKLTVQFADGSEREFLKSEIKEVD